MIDKTHLYFYSETLHLFLSDEFFTDSMGRGLIYRGFNVTRNFLDREERIEGNYYPIVNRILVNYENKGERIGVGVYTDRAQGGTADADGIHLTVHRSSNFDDGLGVGEPLVEKGVDGGKLFSLVPFLSPFPAMLAEQRPSNYLANSYSVQILMCLIESDQL